jgi:hypothetical protein
MFRKKEPKSLPKKPTEYPAGSFLKTEKGYFYIVDGKRRLHLVSRRVLDSWNPPRVIETTEAAVSNYRISSKMKFRNGSLIHSIADGKIYLIVDGQRRHVISPDVYARIGAVGKGSDVISVSLAEINLHQEGTPIS